MNPNQKTDDNLVFDDNSCEHVNIITDSEDVCSTGFVEVGQAV